MADINERQGQEKAYEALLPKAQSLEADKLVSFRADSQLALQNIKTGVGNVLSQKEKLKERFKPEELELLEGLLDNAQAVVFADSQVNTLLSRSTGEISDKLAECYRLRRVLLFGAKACVYAELLSADEERELEKIEQGTGALDASQDCVDLVALYNKNPQLLEHTPATKNMLQNAAKTGSELVLLLKSAAAPKDNVQPEKLRASAEIRDRLWTLLAQGHELLLQAGTLIYGTKKVHRLVPKLQSREVKPRDKKES